MLVALAILSVLAAIAIVNILPSLERTRQQKTMATMRNVALAVESYNQDVGRLPNVGTMAALGTLLDAEGYRLGRRTDGWGNPLIYSTAAASYTLESYGRDGLDGPFDISRTTKSIFENDLVLSDGSFVSSPES